MMTEKELQERVKVLESANESWALKGYDYGVPCPVSEFDGDPDGWYWVFRKSHPDVTWIVTGSYILSPLGSIGSIRYYPNPIPRPAVRG